MLVERYFAGSRQGDHETILALLADDVVWGLPGYARREGKAGVNREIENEAFTGRPTLAIDRLVEEGDTVVAIGTGAASLRTGETPRFACCDVFTFAGDRIRGVQSYLVPLSAGVPAQDPRGSNIGEATPTGAAHDGGVAHGRRPHRTRSTTDRSDPDRRHGRFPFPTPFAPAPDGNDAARGWYVHTVITVVTAMI